MSAAWESAFDMLVASAKASGRLALHSLQPGAKAPVALTVLAPKLLTLFAISCAMAVAGCARNPVHHQVQAAPVHTAPPVHRHTELRIRRPDRALLKPQSAPDCEFKKDDLKTVDPDQFARLKLDYERQCYQKAEKAARERLQLLQASSKCEIIR